MSDIEKINEEKVVSDLSIASLEEAIREIRKLMEGAMIEIEKLRESGEIKKIDEDNEEIVYDNKYNLPVFVSGLFADDGKPWPEDFEWPENSKSIGMIEDPVDIATRDIFRNNVKMAKIKYGEIEKAEEERIAAGIEKEPFDREKWINKLEEEKF